MRVENYYVNKRLRELDDSPFNVKNDKRRLARFADAGMSFREAKVVAVRGSDEIAGDFEVLKNLGTYYLAGPMRGYDQYNFPAFLTTAAVLRSRGFKIMSPADKDLREGLDPTRPLEEQDFDLGAAFRWDIKTIVESNGIILLPGWEASAGAGVERITALFCDLEIYEVDDQHNVSLPREMVHELTWRQPLKVDQG